MSSISIFVVLRHDITQTSISNVYLDSCLQIKIQILKYKRFNKRSLYFFNQLITDMIPDKHNLFLN